MKEIVYPITQSITKLIATSIQLVAIKYYQELIVFSNYGILVHRRILNILDVGLLLRSLHVKVIHTYHLSVGGGCWKTTKALTIVNL